MKPTRSQCCFSLSDFHSSILGGGEVRCGGGQSACLLHGRECVLESSHFICVLENSDFISSLGPMELTAIHTSKLQMIFYVPIKFSMCSRHVH